MYYEINGTLNEITREQINPEVLTVGFITCDVLRKIGDKYRLDEDTIAAGSADKETNIRLLNTKKKLLKYYNYYSQILDITETLEDNDNEIFKVVLTATSPEGEE